jgi:hypothetical protein
MGTKKSCRWSHVYEVAAWQFFWRMKFIGYAEGVAN